MRTLRGRSKRSTFRSGFELNFAKDLKSRGIEYKYEEGLIHYQQQRYYKPDFILDNGIVIETKGYFYSADRTKHRLIKKQHPDLDIRFVFMNPDSKGENSKLTNAQWCDKFGFKYAKLTLPKEWE